jgi:hypothetical protein
VSRLVWVALASVLAWACSPVVVVGSGGSGHGGSGHGGGGHGGGGHGGAGGIDKPPGCVPCSNLGSLALHELDKACPGSRELGDALHQCGCDQCPNCPELCPWGTIFQDFFCHKCFVAGDWQPQCQAELDACINDK